MGRAIEDFKYFWTQGRRSFAIVHFLNQLPQWTYPLGEDRYLEIYEANEQKWSFTGSIAPLAWWREACHFMGGVLLTLPLIAHPTVCFIGTGVVCVFSLLTELLTDLEGSINLKNVMDWASWTLGSACISLISASLFGYS